MDSSLLEGLILGALIATVLAFIFGRYFVKLFARRIFDKWKELELAKEIQRALGTQRPIIKGKISEQIFPLLSNKIGNLSDLRFIGDPIDYIYFKGLSDAREGKITDIEIKLMEVKTGEASLSKSEELVRDAVKGKRIEWEEIKL